MGFINEDGMSISLESSDLIIELEQDIKHFGGDTIVDVWCKDVEGVTLYTNYDFLNEEQPIEKEELKPGEYLKKLSMADLLILLEEQNKVC